MTIDHAINLLDLAFPYCKKVTIFKGNEPTDFKISFSDEKGHVMTTDDWYAGYDFLDQFNEVGQ